MMSPNESGQRCVKLGCCGLCSTKRQPHILSGFLASTPCPLQSRRVILTDNLTKEGKEANDIY